MSVWQSWKPAELPWVPVISMRKYEQGVTGSSPTEPQTISYVRIWALPSLRVPGSTARKATVDALNGLDLTN